MLSLECPDCGSTDFTEDFDCKKCRACRAAGKKIVPKPKFRKKSLSEKSRKLPLKKKIFLGGAFFVLLLIGVSAHFVIRQATAKSLDSLRQQLISQNNSNRFSVETAENFTTISLIQENVRLNKNSEEPLRVEFLFDGVFVGEELTETPQEFFLTIISRQKKPFDIQLEILIFKTDKESFSAEKRDWGSRREGEKSFEYVSYRIPREFLEKIAQTAETSFRLGEYRGNISFEQKQSLKSLLLATTAD